MMTSNGSGWLGLDGPLSGSSFTASSNLLMYLLVGAQCRKRCHKLPVPIEMIAKFVINRRMSYMYS